MSGSHSSPGVGCAGWGGDFIAHKLHRHSAVRSRASQVGGIWTYTVLCIITTIPMTMAGVDFDALSTLWVGNLVFRFAYLAQWRIEEASGMPDKCSTLFKEHYGVQWQCIDSCPSEC